MPNDRKTQKRKTHEDQRKKYAQRSGEADGYRALFSITEVDPAFWLKPILLCYAKDGSSLPEKEGPLRIIVGDEIRHARWVRQVTTIEVGILP